MKIEIIDKIVTWPEDGGDALLAEVSEKNQPIYVRLHSYRDEQGDDHATMHQLEGKKVRVTIETIEK